MNPPDETPAAPAADHGQPVAPCAPPAWQRLIAAARVTRGAGPSRDDTSPFGFSTRVVAQWRRVQEEERRLVLWQRLSWRAALASLTLCALVVVAQRGARPAPDRLLLEPPSITFPGL